jgi:O-antigen/teichoic acid export membrane protein
VLALYLATGGTVSALILLLGRFLAVDLFRVPAALADEAIFVIAGAAITFFISLLSGTFGALMMGMQRMDVWNARLLIYTVLDAAGSAAALMLGYGLRGLVVSRILAVLLIGLANAWTAHKLLPSLRVRPAYFSRRSAREIVGYSVNILVSKLAMLAREPLSKTILLRMVSLSGVTYFDLGGRIAHQARGLFAAVLGPLLPAAAGIQAAGGEQATRRLYLRSTRYVALAVFPAFGGLIVLAHPLIDVWLGPGYGQAALTLQALLAAYFFIVLASPAFTIMEGVGLARVSAITSVVTALLNIGLSVALGWFWGYYGVVAGYALAIAFGSIVTQALFHRRLHLPLNATLQALPWRAVLVDLFAMALAGVLIHYAGLHGIVLLLLVVGELATVCLAGMVVFGGLERDEIATMKRLLLSFAR